LLNSSTNSFILPRAALPLLFHIFCTASMSRTFDNPGSPNKVRYDTLQIIGSQNPFYPRFDMRCTNV
jgi:hypothetical protein